MTHNNSRNINFFTDLVKKHGSNYKSVNWGSIDSQELRFKKLIEIGNLEKKSILDVGCGIGDMFSYIQKNKINLEYCGVDITPKMIELCKERFPQNKNQFKCMDILTLDNASIQYDYVLASGIFYLLIEDPLDIALELIHKMFTFSRKGLAFNSLSSWSKKLEDTEFYMDPIELLQRLKNYYSKIVFVHNYHPSDFTIYLYK